MKRIVSFFGAPNEQFGELNRRAAAYARERNLEYHWSVQDPFDREEVIAELKQSDAGIIDIEPYDDTIFSEICDRTQLLVRFGVGYDKVDLQAASKRAIAVARTTGANTNSVAEMALSLILCVKKQILKNTDAVRRGEWSKTLGHELYGSTVSIIGLGAIGKRLAQLLVPFECRLLAYDPNGDAQAAQRLGVQLVPLEEAVAQADAVSIHVPYTPQTHHMFDAAMLARMKPEAVLVNTARGNIIDEDALYAALAAKKLAGAGIDVFAQEPLPMDSPLRKLDNIVLTSHISSQTLEALWNVYKMAIDIAADFFEGKPSPHILNPDYKSYVSK